MPLGRLSPSTSMGLVAAGRVMPACLPTPAAAAPRSSPQVDKWVRRLLRANLGDYEVRL